MLVQFSVVTTGSLSSLSAFKGVSNCLEWVWLIAQTRMSGIVGEFRFRGVCSTGGPELEPVTNRWGDEAKLKARGSTVFLFHIWIFNISYCFGCERKIQHLPCILTRRRVQPLVLFEANGEGTVVWYRILYCLGGSC